jgi:hypothetical protein
VVLQIDPEPSPEEHAAIVAALEQAASLGADRPSPWGRPELEDEPASQPTGT